MKRLAVRNLRLCTKDCLCLYVCPTGATDTENSIIDPARCIGCGTCAGACPSGAITMVPDVYPPQQPKTEAVTATLRALSRRKAEQEKTARQIAGVSSMDGLTRLMTAAARSIRLVSEDVLRESGYMLPQSGNVHAVLRELIESPPTPDFPAETAKQLMDRLPVNDAD